MTERMNGKDQPGEAPPPPPDEECYPTRRPIGRPRGARNKKRAATIDLIEREADPVSAMISIANGKKLLAADKVGDRHAKWANPTLEMRIDAIKWLGERVSPRLKAVEIGVTRRIEDMSDDELRALLGPEGAAQLEAEALAERASPQTPQMASRDWTPDK
jgi:hypothetical protein